MPLGVPTKWVSINVIERITAACGTLHGRVLIPPLRLCPMLIVSKIASPPVVLLPVCCHVASDPRHLSRRARRACTRFKNTTKLPGIISVIDPLRERTPRDNHCCNTKAEQRETVPLGLLGTLPLQVHHLLVISGSTLCSSNEG